MLCRINIRENLGDVAVRINEKGVSGRELHNSQVGQRPVGSTDLMAGVGEEFEVQPFFGAKVFVRIDAVDADSENDGVAIGIFRLVHLKLVGFSCSPRSLIFWIEIKHNPFTPKIFQAD